MDPKLHPGWWISVLADHKTTLENDNPGIPVKTELFLEPIFPWKSVQMRGDNCCLSIPVGARYITVRRHNGMFSVGYKDLDRKIKSFISTDNHPKESESIQFYMCCAEGKEDAEQRLMESDWFSWTKLVALQPNIWHEPEALDGQDPVQLPITPLVCESKLT